MANPVGLALWAMAYLLLKHAIADFFLQTPYQYRNKGSYGHPGGLLHAGIHVLCTLPVFLILSPASLRLPALIVVGEYVVHYHVDWLKEQVVKRKAWTVTDAAYWQALGLDQLAHGLTYVAIIALLSDAAS